MSDNLPEPPLRVYAKEGASPRRPAWWVRFDEEWISFDGDYCDSENLTVIPHTLNDERAVALINEAKGAKP